MERRKLNDESLHRAWDGQLELLRSHWPELESANLKLSALFAPICCRELTLDELVHDFKRAQRGRCPAEVMNANQDQTRVGG